jgi:thioredoxin reductase (NADPH)
VHPGIVRDKVLELLRDDAHKEARARVEQTHLHIGTEDIVRNVVERIRLDYSDFVRILDEKAVRAERDGALYVLATEEGSTVHGQAVVLSTGAMDRQPSVKMTLKSGKLVDDIHWIYPYANHETLLYCIRCEGHLTRGTRTAVLGSSEAAAQIALMLHERYGTEVTILTNGEAFEASEPTRRLLGLYGIRVLTPRIVDLIDEEGGRKGERLRAFELEDGSRIEARFGLVAMGLYRVYNELARQLGAELEAGVPDEVQHVLVDERTSETSVRGLFAVGDMSRTRGGTSPSMKQVYTAQEYAVRAVDTIDARRRKAAREALLGG